MAQWVKNLPAMQEMQEKEMATHWTEELGREEGLNIQTIK